MSVAVVAPPDQIRLHHAPPIDPPFDDELFPSLFQPHLHEAFFEPPPPVMSPSSREGHTAALRFLNLCLELFNGFRSAAQMRPLLHAQDALRLHDELADIARRLSHLRRRHPGVKVRRCQLRTCEPRAGVIEVAAVLNDGSRAWAMCYRMERQDIWRCTFLHALLPDEAPGARPGDRQHPVPASAHRRAATTGAASARTASPGTTTTGAASARTATTRTVAGQADRTAS